MGKPARDSRRPTSTFRLSHAWRGYNAIGPTATTQVRHSGASTTVGGWRALTCTCSSAPAGPCRPCCWSGHTTCQTLHSHSPGCWPCIAGAMRVHRLCMSASEPVLARMMGERQPGTCTVRWPTAVLQGNRTRWLLVSFASLQTTYDPAKSTQMGRCSTNEWGAGQSSMQDSQCTVECWLLGACAAAAMLTCSQSRPLDTGVHASRNRPTDTNTTTQHQQRTLSS